jgi:selenide, water dikinase
MGPDTLAQVLQPLHSMFTAEKFPDLLVGLEKSDDAAVYRLSDDRALIHTVDFFTPIVDDPRAYGAIAAANALSDVYAMGGEPVLALNICAFPHDLPIAITTEIIRGGAEKVAEAGAVLAGGHTILDNEPKYGLSVIGFCHPNKILTKAGARTGDKLVLTKPLGSGIITTAAKADKADAADVQKAVAGMLLLNRAAAQAARAAGVTTCTDITGFAILGHAREMAEKSGVGLRLSLASLPFLDGSRRYASEKLFPGGASRNETFYGPFVKFDSSIDAATRRLLFTPETSGGLLIAVAAAKHDLLLSEMKSRGQACWTVGEVVSGAGVEVVG